MNQNEASTAMYLNIERVLDLGMRKLQDIEETLGASERISVISNTTAKKTDLSSAMRSS